MMSVAARWRDAWAPGKRRRIITGSTSEAFNVFNRANYQVPVFLLDNSNVGRVTSTVNDPRELQFAVKLVF